MWHGLLGQTKRFAGASGTVTIPKGCSIVQVAAHSAGAATVTFPDGSGGTITLPVPTAGFGYQPNHLLCSVSADFSMVFTGTDGYFVEIYFDRGTTS